VKKFEFWRESNCPPLFLMHELAVDVHIEDLVISNAQKLKRLRFLPFYSLLPQSVSLCWSQCAGYFPERVERSANCDRIHRRREGLLLH